MDKQKTYDFIVIGSGFGGSIAAMRLVEKGYEVLVIERGKRFHDEDFSDYDGMLRGLSATGPACWSFLALHGIHRPGTVSHFGLERSVSR